jgi:hypothetical protein
VIVKGSGHGVVASPVRGGGQGEASTAFLSSFKPQRISALTKEELTVWALANGWRVIAGHPSLTKPGAPNDPIVRLVLKATVVNLEVRKPAGKWEKVAGESYTHVVQGSEDEPPRGLGFEKVPSITLLMRQNRDAVVFGRMSRS